MPGSAAGFFITEGHAVDVTARRLGSAQRQQQGGGSGDGGLYAAGMSALFATDRDTDAGADESAVSSEQEEGGIASN